MSANRPLRALGWIAVSSTDQIGEDKFSLEKQESDIRQLCEVRGWRLVALLKVPGFSRDYYTMAEAAAAMRRENITAFDDLQEMIDRRAFDLFLCRDGDRFGRKLALVAEVTGKIRDIGATIHTITSGEIDMKGATMWSAFTGLRAQGDIEKLVEFRHAGMRAKAFRGLPSGIPPLSHKVIRNELGKSLRLVVNEENRLLCEDAAQLLLKGVGWDNLEVEVSKLGHPLFRRNTFHKLFFNPFFWGHAAYGRKKKGTKFARQGLWCIDERYPAPDDVTIQYNTHEPMFTGEFGERVKSEMRRRTESIKGRARPHRTGIFTGLIICGGCGYNAGFIQGRQPNNKYYGCTSNQKHSLNGQCANRGYIHINTAREEINTLLLRPVLSGVELETLLHDGGGNNDLSRQISAVESAIIDVRERVKKLIRDRVRHQGLEEIYGEEIEKEGQQLEVLQQRLKELWSKVSDKPVTDHQRRAVSKIGTIEEFWLKDWTTINQHLHEILDGYRFVLLDGHLVGIKMT